MDLKRFQRRVVDEVEEYLRLMAKHRAGGNVRYASRAAWDDLGLEDFNASLMVNDALR